MKVLTAGSWLMIGLLTGCRTGNIVPADDTESARRPLRMVHYTWRGISPGAGFLRTESTTVEIDLTQGKIRDVSLVAKAPSPMLLHHGHAILANQDDQEWRDLDAEHKKLVIQAVDAWLKTAPPKRCKIRRYVGREDGYTAGLILFTSTGEYTVYVNPPKEVEDVDSCPPMPEYQPLIDAIHAWPPAHITHGAG